LRLGIKLDVRTQKVLKLPKEKQPKQKRCIDIRLIAPDPNTKKGEEPAK
jgi:hypothetical protein